MVAAPSAPGEVSTTKGGVWSIPSASAASMFSRFEELKKRGRSFRITSVGTRAAKRSNWGGYFAR